MHRLFKNWTNGSSRSTTSFIASASSTSREIAFKESEVLNALRTIPNEIVGRDVVVMSMVKDVQILNEGKRVSFAIQTPSLALKQNETWIKRAHEAVKSLPWAEEVDVTLKAAPRRNARARRDLALKNVSNIIAVSSCKGGVGKSTVSVNLAFSLAKRGAKVGILDADIYGPSLPTMVSPRDLVVRHSRSIKNFIEPIDYEGVKCMSFGFVNAKAAPGAGGKGAAIMRGPMVSKLIDQLALGTDWGELDYLIIDMPPGTGDIQMSLSQQVPINGAVIVTTPQKLSRVDVEKGIEMFANLKIPTAAIVENMSYFDCIHGHRHYPFGKGHLKELAKEYKVSKTFSFPITPELSACADNGRPLVLDRPEKQVSIDYDILSAGVAEELVRIAHDSNHAPELSHDLKRGIILRLYDDEKAAEYSISSQELRFSCRCAKCVDEFTGRQLLDVTTVPEDIKPTRIQQKGNYAYAVTWSDGHDSSLYTFDHLRSIVSKKP